MSMRRLFRVRLRETLHLLDDGAIRALRRAACKTACRCLDVIAVLREVDHAGDEELAARESARELWREASTFHTSAGTDDAVARAWERDALTGYPVGIGPRGNA